VSWHGARTPNRHRKTKNDNQKNSKEKITAEIETKKKGDSHAPILSAHAMQFVGKHENAEKPKKPEKNRLIWQCDPP